MVYPPLGLHAPVVLLITVRIYLFIYFSKNFYGFPIKTFGNDVSKASIIFYTI